jgi:hypothetical protein
MRKSLLLNVLRFIMFEKKKKKKKKKKILKSFQNIQATWRSVQQLTQLRIKIDAASNLSEAVELVNSDKKKRTFLDKPEIEICRLVLYAH